MSYCVQCGVKLADYHKKCPLCGTEIINPNKPAISANTDYPDYHVVNESEKKPIRHYVTGIIISLQAFVYAVVVFFIDWLTGNGISWSVIPIVSLAFLWFTVAYPFLTKKRGFFRFFTYDSAAVIAYVVLLNYIIRQNFFWAKYAAAAVLFLWIIIAGIFLTDKIKKVFPITIYYIISAVVFAFVSLGFVEQKIVILKLGLPVMISFIVISLISYFVIKSSSSKLWPWLTVPLVAGTLLCLIIDGTLYYHEASSIGFSWSLIVLAVAVPVAATLLVIKRSNELYALISRKLHR